jgi:hypothetical protein
MLVFFGILGVLGVLLVCGGSSLDEPKSQDDRLNLGLGVFVFTVVLSVIMAVLL